MNAPYDQDVFLGYLEGDLGPGDQARFEQMLVNDARLRNLVAQLVGDRQKLRELPREEPPPELMDGISQRLERQILLDEPVEGRVGVAESSRWGRRLAYSGVAALVFVSATVVVLIISESRQIRSTNQASSRLQADRTGAGGEDGGITGSPETAALQPRRAFADVVAIRPEPDVPKQFPLTAKLPLPSLADANEPDTDAISIIDDLFLKKAEASNPDDANVDGATGGPTEPDALATPDYLHEFEMAETEPTDGDRLAALDEPVRGDAEVHGVIVNETPLIARFDAPQDEMKLPGLGGAKETPAAPTATDVYDKSDETATGFIAASPPTRIEVFTFDTVAARRHLLNWVKARSASAKATDPTMLYRTETTSATTRKSSLGRGSKTPTLPDEVFLVKIPADQLPSLVVYLDAPPNQTAAVDRSAQGGAAGAVPTLLANQGAKVERGKDPHRIGGAVRPEAKDRRTAKPSVPSVAGSRLRPVAIFTTPLPEEDGQRTLQLDSNASTDAEPLMSVAVVIRSQRRIEEAQDVLRDSQRRTD